MGEQQACDKKPTLRVYTPERGMIRKRSAASAKEIDESSAVVEALVSAVPSPIAISHARSTPTTGTSRTSSTTPVNGGATTAPPRRASSRSGSNHTNNFRMKGVGRNHRGKRGNPPWYSSLRSWIRWFSSLSSHQKRLAVFALVGCFFSICLIVGLVYFKSIQEQLFGASSSPRGGVLGNKVDKFLAKKFLAQIRAARRRDTSLVFPEVTVKATREIRKGHYNQYLREILQRHQPNQTNIDWKGYQSNATQFSEPSRRRPRRTIKLMYETGVLATSRTTELKKDLQKEKCEASWLCQRCLNTAYLGTFDSCSLLCRRCYIRILSQPQPHVKDPFTISAPVVETDRRITVDRRIPRIIHQAWLFGTRTLEFPELARIQTTWRSVKGYEYHYYTPDRASDFVKEHYPAIVSQAYERIPSQMKQRDFFKMLALFKLGGIFSNVDVTMDVRLDALIEPNTSFIAPRSDDDLLNNCLSNLFVAAEPGHPILARAIENVMRLLLLGSEAHENKESESVERFILESSGKAIDETEVWKLRAVETQEVYVYSGCGLGVAANQVLLGRDTPLSDFDVGKERKSVGGGDLLILLTSRDDTGAKRITDVDRNLLVASTELIGLDRMDIRQKSRLRLKATRKDKAELVV